MANPSRAKGTRWEVTLLVLLREVFGPDVHRAPLRGIQDAGDYVGTPLLVEAKSTKAPHFLEWARTAARKAGSWVVVWHGDRRKGEGPFVLMSLEYWLELEARRPANPLVPLDDDDYGVPV